MQTTETERRTSLVTLRPTPDRDASARRPEAARPNVVVFTVLAAASGALALWLCVPLLRRRDPIEDARGRAGGFT
jgi:hypothetical protein